MLSPSSCTCTGPCDAARISSGHPAGLSASPSNTSSGHAWVCRHRPRRRIAINRSLRVQRCTNGIRFPSLIVGGAELVAAGYLAVQKVYAYFSVRRHSQRHTTVNAFRCGSGAPVDERNAIVSGRSVQAEILAFNTVRPAKLKLFARVLW